MGLFDFFKDKLTSRQLAENLSLIIFNSIEDDHLESYKKVLKGIGESDIISENQKKEIMVIELLALTRAIQNNFTNTDKLQLVLDLLYTQIYNKISKKEKEQTEFEKFIHKRANVYYNIFLSNSDYMAFAFGKQFADYFFGKDFYDPRFINFIADTFRNNIEGEEKLISDLMSKYDMEN